jgi:hypothetical protein
MPDGFDQGVQHAGGAFGFAEHRDRVLVGEYGEVELQAALWQLEQHAAGRVSEAAHQLDVGSELRQVLGRCTSRRRGYGTAAPIAHPGSAGPGC